MSDEAFDGDVPRGESERQLAIPGKRMSRRCPRWAVSYIELILLNL